jgi:hypothetical protein
VGAAGIHTSLIQKVEKSEELLVLASRVWKEVQSALDHAGAMLGDDLAQRVRLLERSDSVTRTAKAEIEAREGILALRAALEGKP